MANPYPLHNNAYYATSEDYPDGAWVGAGASTTIKSGKSITIELNPSASQKIGTLTGPALYTCISEALVQGCGTVAPSATMVSCSVPAITPIGYVEDGVDGVWNDGGVSIDIPLMPVTDNNGLQALIPSAEWRRITNIAALAQAVYTDGVSGANGNNYLCDPASLAGSALYCSGFIVGVLGATPGFEWTEGLAVAIERADAGSDSALQAASFTCELQSLTGSK